MRTKLADNLKLRLREWLIHRYLLSQFPMDLKHFINTCRCVLEWKVHPLTDLTDSISAPNCSIDWTSKNCIRETISLKRNMLSLKQPLLKSSLSYRCRNAFKLDILILKKQFSYCFWLLLWIRLRKHLLS